MHYQNATFKARAEHAFSETRHQNIGACRARNHISFLNVFYQADLYQGSRFAGLPGITVW